jgi:propionyl-CoA carboxylase alpha chain
MTGGNLELSSSVAALWIQGFNRKNSNVLNQIPSGWRNSKLPRQKLSFKCLEEEVTISYQSRRDGSFDLNEGSVANIFKWEESGIDIEIDGRRFYSKVTQDSKTIVVHMPWGNAVLEILPRFILPGNELESGGLVAPMPGKVIDLKVKVGSKVKKGDTLVILEAMKMEHQVKASEDGKVSKLLIKKDDQLENGALLMIVDPK